MNIKKTFLNNLKIKNSSIIISLIFTSQLYIAQDQFNNNSQITQSVLDASSFSTGSTGSVDISIPITSLEIDNFNLDVKVKHNSTGIKVNRDADLLGVNWDINSVGLISREIKGLPDELNTMVILESNTGGCIKLSEMQNVGYFYNRDRVKNSIISYESSYPNVPLSIGADLTVNGLNSHFFVPPRLYSTPSDDPGFMKDYEPDIFTVVIPGYKPFKFFFDLDKKIVITPNDNYKITYTEENGELLSFEVIDKNGTKFKFSNKEKRRLSNLKSEFEISGILNDTDISNTIENPPVLNSLCAGFDPQHVANYKKQYVKSWYLDLITNIKGESIFFKYKNLELYSISPLYGIRPNTSDYIIYPNNDDYGILRWEYSQFGGSFPVYYPKFQKSAVVTTTPILKSINTVTKAIYLTEGNPRQDIFNNGFTKYNEIKSIDVWSYNGPELFIDIDYYLTYSPNNIPSNYKKTQSFEFDYIYSLADYTDISSNYLYARKRLFLHSITQKSSGNNIIKYYLTYNGDLNELPHKQSAMRDMWNYYKKGTDLNVFPNLYYYPNDGRDNVDLGPFSIYKRPSFTGSEVSILNYYPNYPLKPVYFTDKTPDINNTSIGSLKSITTSMGGITNFYYEPNYFKYYGVKRPSGGLRIKSIESVESGKKNITDFYYGTNEDGIGHVYMNTGINRRSYNPHNNMRFDQNAPIFGGNIIKLNFLEEASSITYYDQVKKINRDENGNSKGYSISRYSLFKDSDNHSGFQLGNVFYKSNIFSSYSLIYDSNPNQNQVYYTTNTKDYYPFNEKETFADISGFLLNEKVYDKNNTLLKENDFSYNLKVQEYKFINDDNSGYQPAASLYKIRKFDYLLENATIKDYFDNNILVTSTSNEYNSLNLLNKISTLTPDNKIFLKQLKYCYETDNSFVGLNRFSELCEEKEVKNNKSIITKHLYQNFEIPKLTTGSDVMGGFYVYYIYPQYKLPYMSQISLDGNIYKNGAKINKIGKLGKVLESELNTIPETTIYGYYQTLPIAKIKGATQSQVLQAFNLNPLDYESYLQLDIVKKSDLDIDGPTESDLLLALDNFRNNDQLKNYEITTYTYDPAIGITSMTLPTGIKEYYKYDNANRLAKILNNTNNIVKEFNYGSAPIKYYNEPKSKTFTRNNCNSFYEEPGQYTYAVPANIYFSYINKDDANQQAENDININGQNAANINGICIPRTICAFSFANNFVKRSNPAKPEIYTLPGSKTVNLNIAFSNYPINASYWTRDNDPNNWVTIGYIPSSCIPANAASSGFLSYQEVPGGAFGDTPANRRWQVMIFNTGEVKVNLNEGSVGNNSYNPLTFRLSIQL